jgi:hypothetical protein
MVDSVPIRHTMYLYPVTNIVRPSVDAGEMITPAQELGTTVQTTRGRYVGPVEMSTVCRFFLLL